jgi:hypothetical protein
MFNNKRLRGDEKREGLGRVGKYVALPVPARLQLSLSTRQRQQHDMRGLRNGELFEGP